jgi:hypothetical protein
VPVRGLRGRGDVAVLAGCVALLSGVKFWA